ncbi:right-handed parallel beta-helix repeat-containing protein [Rhizobium sp. BK491]|uniref:right-handed parallel beta-helix repeat-containing protein n=1 Tax=Rhizobium sp. BK491 TaxID=2587009 RepID=UPI000DD92A4A|nr:right-handed parallel beta-helix repeat-containing protein [Rhizobium sp. BK491]MBB3571257.1 hypothetical protein [Rhizobium sp. BK491]
MPDIADNAVSENNLNPSLTITMPTVVASRAALKALNATGRYNTAYLGEAGREGIFARKSGTPFPDPQEGRIIVSNTPGCYWERVVEDDIYHATWWGVRGDDATDNTAMLQAAITALPPVPVALLLPAGVIRVNDQITIGREYFTLRGAGAGTTTVRQFNPAVTTFYCAVAAPNSIHGITIAGININTASSIVSTAGALIYVEKGNGIRLEDLDMGGGYYEIYLAGCFGVQIDNCRAANGYKSPSTRSNIMIGTANPSWGGIYGGNIFINNCDFQTAYGQSGTPGAQYGMQVRAVDGLFVSNSYFGYYETAAVALLNSGGFVAGVKFSNCWFDHQMGNGVFVSGGANANFSGGAWIGCNFVGGTSANYNFFAEGNPRGIEIVGCELSWVSGDNIRINTTQGSIVIANNKIRLADIDNQAGGEGIAIVAGSDVVITGNVIDGEGYTDSGIVVSGNSNRGVVSNNRVTNCTHGIRFEGNAGGFVAVGNNTLGNSGVGMLNTSSGSITIPAGTNI